MIVTGTGRLILTDKDREITFMQVADEPVFVEPTHLLACEEGLQPRYVRLGDEAARAVEVVALEGRGMVALSVASKPLPLTVTPDQPVSVPASSVIMWTAPLVPHVVDDPQIYAVCSASAGAAGRLLRLEGTGRILVEQTPASPGLRPPTPTAGPSARPPAARTPRRAFALIIRKMVRPEEREPDHHPHEREQQAHDAGSPATKPGRPARR